MVVENLNLLPLRDPPVDHLGPAGGAHPVVPAQGVHRGDVTVLLLAPAPSYQQEEEGRETSLGRVHVLAQRAVNDTTDGALLSVMHKHGYSYRFMILEIVTAGFL